MSWINNCVDGQSDSFRETNPFGPQTLPYGVVRTHTDDWVGPAVAVRVANYALPLHSVAEALGDRLSWVARAGTLDPLLSAGRGVWTELRERLTELVHADTTPNSARLVPLADVETAMPFTVADFVDFYSSRQHVENASRILRPGSPSLAANWTHLPVAYHGRAGSVVVSGTPIARPHGQYRLDGEQLPTFGPTRQLDIEAEVGFVCGGRPSSEVPTSQAAEHVFGVVLVNDWSARDFQAWEAQPLGPFLAKSFATSISAWVTPLEALDACRVWPPEPEQELFDYLTEDQPSGLDLGLRVECNGVAVSEPPFAEMSWSFAQQLAHMTVGGASVRAGDLFASGTVSGKRANQQGSFLELSSGGKHPISRERAAQRSYLEDGDEVVITATAGGPDDSVVGLGEVRGTIQPAGR